MNESTLNLDPLIARHFFAAPSVEPITTDDLCAEMASELDLLDRWFRAFPFLHLAITGSAGAPAGYTHAANTQGTAYLLPGEGPRAWVEQFVIPLTLQISAGVQSGPNTTWAVLYPRTWLSSRVLRALYRRARHPVPLVSLYPTALYGAPQSGGLYPNGVRVSFSRKGTEVFGAMVAMLSLSGKRDRQTERSGEPWGMNLPGGETRFCVPNDVFLDVLTRLEDNGAMGDARERVARARSRPTVHTARALNSSWETYMRRLRGGKRMGSSHSLSETWLDTVVVRLLDAVIDQDERDLVGSRNTPRSAYMRGLRNSILSTLAAPAWPVDYSWLERSLHQAAPVVQAHLDHVRNVRKGWDTLTTGATP